VFAAGVRCVLRWFREVCVFTRNIFLRLSDSRRMEAIVRRTPVSAPLVRRFIAGETMDDAEACVRELNAKGISATLDYLGENVSNADEARESAQRCIEVIRLIASRNLDANLSVKLTEIGLDLSTDMATDNLRAILEEARSAGQFVRIDMESSAHVDRTLEVFHALWPEYKNVGLVFQSYLYRTDKDVEQAIQEGVRVRLVKGAYDEPPTVAYRNKSDVDASYCRLAQRLLKEGEYPAIATHDVKILNFVKDFCGRENIGPDRFEFQMLYGIRRDLQESLVREGYRMRVYTPFGTQWYGYTMRRLAERPANIWFVAKNILRR